MRLARLIFAPSAIANIVFGEADPPTILSRTSVFGERYESGIIAQNSQGGTRCPQRVGMRASPPELAPSAIAIIVFGEADPPMMLSRTSVFGELDH
jgi:hypothetical protein